jgi:hypothetical protein
MGEDHVDLTRDSSKVGRGRKKSLMIRRRFVGVVTLKN